MSDNPPKQDAAARKAAELLPCECDRRDPSGDTINRFTGHEDDCLAHYRPAVAAKLREQQQFIKFTEQNRDEWAKRAEERLFSLSERDKVIAELRERIVALDNDREAWAAETAKAFALLKAAEADNERLRAQAVRKADDAAYLKCRLCRATGWELRDVNHDPSCALAGSKP